MTFFELFLIGIGLSMDAFAVSICKGLSMQKIDKKYTLCIGLFFGGFQALMPLTGYLLGSLVVFTQYRTDFYRFRNRNPFSPAGRGACPARRCGRRAGPE